MKLKMQVEVMLPTMVTKEIELPIFLYDKTERNCLMIKPNETGSTILPFVTHEVHTYSDGTKRLWIRHDTEKSFMQLVNQIGEDLHEIKAEDFIHEVKQTIDQQIEYYNELLNELE